jgi:hypothetical protein
LALPNGPTIRLNNLDWFSKEIKRLAGTDFHTACNAAAAARLPFSDYMDYMPNGVMRLVQLGLKPEALGCTPSGSASAATPAPSSALLPSTSRR